MSFKPTVVNEIESCGDVLDELSLTVKPIIEVSAELLYQMSDGKVQITSDMLLFVHHSLKTALSYWGNVADFKEKATGGAGVTPLSLLSVMHHAEGYTEEA